MTDDLIEQGLLRIVWLGPVVDDSTLLTSPAVSPAANRWQLGLISALKRMGVAVSVISHLPEPVWPRGRLRINRQDGCLPAAVEGHLTEYWNVPAWRNQSVGSGYRRLIRQTMDSETGRGVVITYNGYPTNVAGATYARKRYGMPWVCIVADDEAPRNADGYVFLSWGYYEAFGGSKPKLHLDGGVSGIRFSPERSRNENSSRHKVVMYTGNLTLYGGVDLLAQAFYQLDRPDIELWICGKGSSPKVERLAAIDSRIKLMGVVPEQELEYLAHQADVFVNPRPSNVPGNEKNFPSKVLEYLSFGTPVISTWTDGLSLEYREVLVVLEKETPSCLAQTIENVLNWPSDQRRSWSFRAVTFLESYKTWDYQALGMCKWLKSWVSERS